MNKFVLSLFCFVALFLLTFSAYRVLNGGETLTLESFLNVLGDLNFDFENLSKHYLMFEEEISIDTSAIFAPFPTLSSSDLVSFFSSLGNVISTFFNRFVIFFELVYDYFNLFVWFVIDAVTIISNIVKMFISFLGITPVFY